jgi:hypothetical protein
MSVELWQDNARGTHTLLTPYLRKREGDREGDREGGGGSDKSNDKVRGRTRTCC